jgi:CHAT domain-containing protein
MSQLNFSRLRKVAFFLIFHCTVYGQVDSLRGAYQAYFKKGKADTAYTLANQLLSTLEVGMQAQSASILHDLGMMSPKADAAESFFKQSLALKEKLFGRSSDAYVNTLREMGGFYERQKKGKEALVCYDEALKTAQSGSLNLWMSYYAANSKATYLINSGNYPEALMVSEQVLKLNDSIRLKKETTTQAVQIELGRSQIMPTDAYVKAAFWSVQSSCYFKMWALEEAIEKAEQALSIYRQAPSRIPNLMYAILNSNGNAYNEIGQTDKALIFYQEALDTLKNLKFTKTIPYAQVLGNIALCFNRQKQIDKALPYLRQSLALRDSFKTSNPREYALALNNLGAAFLETGELDSSFSLIKTALSIKDTLEDEHNHPDFGVNLRTLGDYYYRTNQPLLAVNYYEKGFEHYKRLQKINHARTIEMALKCGLANVNAHEIPSAKKRLTLFNTQQFEHIRHNFAYMNDNAKAEFLNTFEDQYAELQSLNTTDSTQLLTKILFENALIYKGVLLQNNQNFTQKLSQSKDLETQTRFKEWQTLRRQLEAESSNPLSIRRLNLDSLENIVAHLESELIKKAGNKQEQTKAIQWKAIQSNLKHSEACIEFVHFNLIRQGKPTDSTIYGAYIIRKTKQPQWEKKQLDSVFNHNTSTEQLVATLYTRGIKPAQASSNTLSKDLYRLVWSPLDTFLKNITTVQYAPSGLLHRIAFDAIPLSKTAVLADKYALTAISSSRQILTKKDAPKLFAPIDAALFGAVNYDKDNPTTQSPVAFRIPTPSLSNLRSASNNIWQSLEGTRQELDSIEFLCNKNRIPATVLTGVQASESYFKNFGDPLPSPSIIHIASHGYFFSEENKDDTTESIFALSKNPLIRSGILLAGANRAWRGEHLETGQEDGILTAFEISQLNLSHTKLAVLSACETGLGDIRGNEGVYGLQRAFKMAGVQYLLVSLWKIPDTQTAELMTQFYKHLFIEKDIHTAFRKAQQYMRGHYTNPFYWAGFVLIE